MTKLYAGLAAATVMAMLAGTAFYAWRVSGDRFAECGAGQVAGGGAIGGPFTLIDQTGATVTEAEVITGPTLVYFGYTFCPDVCPLDNARNAEAVDILEEMGLEVKPVFISVDPARDTPPVLAEYSDYIHPAMVALTGSPEQVRAAEQAYKVYSGIPAGQDEYYLVDHTTLTYLMVPPAPGTTGFVDFFRRDIGASEIAERTACLIQGA